MRRETYGWVAAASIVAVALFPTARVAADPMDGSKNIVCALLEVVGCTEIGQCYKGSAR